MAQKTIQVADKPTLDELKALLENSGYGLEAIKDLIGSSSSGMVCKEESEVASEYIADGCTGGELAFNSESGAATYNICTDPNSDYLYTFSNTTSQTLKTEIYKSKGYYSNNPTSITLSPGNYRDTYFNPQTVMIGKYIYFLYTYYDSSAKTALAVIDTSTFSILNIYKPITSIGDIRYCSMFTDGVSLYIVNGGNSTIYKWSGGTTFTSFKTLPYIPYEYSLYNPTLCSYKGYIYLIGGHSSLKNYNEIWKLVNDSWVIVAYLPSEIYGASAIEYNDYMYITYGKEKSKSLIVFDGYNIFVIENSLPNSSQGHIEGPRTLQLYNGKILSTANGKYIGNYTGTNYMYYVLISLNIYKRRIILPKNKRIFLDTTYGMKYVILYTNCKIEDDHLVVLENGVVEFGVQAFDKLKRISCF